MGSCTTIPPQSFELNLVPSSTSFITAGGGCGGGGGGPGGDTHHRGGGDSGDFRGRRHSSNIALMSMAAACLQMVVTEPAAAKKQPEPAEKKELSIDEMAENLSTLAGPVSVLHMDKGKGGIGGGLYAQLMQSRLTELLHFGQAVLSQALVHLELKQLWFPKYVAYLPHMWEREDKDSGLQKRSHP
eukprot:1144019-Pelagomonas_calceolata.AAC.2